MSEKVKMKITRKQFKEMLGQFLQNPSFNAHKSSDNEYYTFVSRKGDVIITIYKFDKSYFMEIFSSS